MNMENENVNQISYEALKQAYDQLLRQAQEMERGYQALLNDRMIEKLKAICAIVENRECYSEKVLKLADWHLEQMLAKPTRSK